MRRVLAIVVHQHLDDVGPGGNKTPHGPLIEQIWQASLNVCVVAGFFIGEKYASIGSTMLHSFQPILRVEQNSAGIPCKHLRNLDLKFAQIFAGGITPPGFCNGLLE